MFAARKEWLAFTSERCGVEISSVMLSSYLTFCHLTLRLRITLNPIWLGLVHSKKALIAAVTVHANPWRPYRCLLLKVTAGSIYLAANQPRTSVRNGGYERHECTELFQPTVWRNFLDTLVNVYRRRCRFYPVDIDRRLFKSASHPELVVILNRDRRRHSSTASNNCVVTAGLLSVKGHQRIELLRWIKARAKRGENAL